jgi:hypothetical protein
MDLQRGTAAATQLGVDRHAHQLWSFCFIFVHLENIHCASLLGSGCIRLAQSSDALRVGLSSLPLKIFPASS